MPSPRQEDIPDEVINRIAERAAEKALEKVYAEVGKSVLRKMLWILGAAALAAFARLKSKGLV